MQNTIQKFRQSSIVFKKPSILSENFDELQLPYILIFFSKTSHKFSTYHYLQKGVCEFFYFIWILIYLQKLKTTWLLHTRFLHFY